MNAAPHPGKIEVAFESIGQIETLYFYVPATYPTPPIDSKHVAMSQKNLNQKILDYRISRYFCLHFFMKPVGGCKNSL